MAKKWVYLFEEGNASLRDLLGGKGANLAEMANLGLPVPPGFTITTEACIAYYEAGGKFPEGMWEEELEALKVIEERTGKKFGDRENPLLVSVRSGARVSMPGMMDTVLNLGLNPDTVAGMMRLTGNPRFVWDAYRRLVQMFGHVVLGVEGDKFEEVIAEHKKRLGVKDDTGLTAQDWEAITREFKEIVRRKTGQDFPDDPYEQLRLGTDAVFRSWNVKRAVDYRNFHRIPHTWGTAVNVVTMVYGNMGFDSGTGVAFTRDPSTGEKVLYGDYLLNAQGEDVVAGIRNTKPIRELAQDMPANYRELVRICELLEKHYRDMQDVEFTIERGRLWMLQTRTGKRTAQAAVKAAVDMVREGLIAKEEAVMRVEPLQVIQLLLPRFDEAAKEKARQSGMFLASGLNASPGAATGKAIFHPDTAEEEGLAGEAVILVRAETSPDDVHGMLQAKGILTARGGATSHAAVVARGLGKPCVAGCEALRIDEASKTFSVNSQVVKEGDYISIDGTTGEVFSGQIATIEPRFAEERDLITLLGYADEIRRLGVWANADYPRDAERAREFGAEGVGLCRTEHMFFEQDRLPIVQEMILAESDEARQAALDKLLPVQKEDFKGIFRAMEGLPVIIRLLDPPLHEFLPSHEELLVEVTELHTQLRVGCFTEVDDPEYQRLRRQLVEKRALLAKVEAMREANPMLGLRGCRLGLSWPAINEMQVRAIFEAACELTREGVEVHPEVMIPLVGHVNELRVVRVQLEKVAESVMERLGKISYKFGTMIEVPRAALTADQIAQYAQFFSFGTNDLTQMGMGISRDDAEGKFLLKYVQDGILPENPFQVLDREGIGQLVQMAVEKGRRTRPDLEIGICGEHGGDPSSIEFCHQVGLNYVSCSPFRVPVARLAAAQAALGGARAGDV